jgi:hypothetical protein
VLNQGSDNVSILLADADGTFEQAVNYSAGLNPTAIAVGDFNGDGKLDLVVSNSDSNGESGKRAAGQRRRHLQGGQFVLHQHG